VLPAAVTARVAVEQASNFGWERYTGRTGRIIGMRSFEIIRTTETTADVIRLHR
jgi:transketolase